MFSSFLYFDVRSATKKKSVNDKKKKEKLSPNLSFDTASRRILYAEKFPSIALHWDINLESVDEKISFFQRWDAIVKQTNIKITRLVSLATRTVFCFFVIQNFSTFVKMLQSFRQLASSKLSQKLWKFFPFDGIREKGWETLNIFQILRSFIFSFSFSSCKPEQFSSLGDLSLFVRF